MFIYKSQRLFSLAFWFIFDRFFDSPKVKEAISFYIHDEINIINGLAARSPEPPELNYQHVGTANRKVKIDGSCGEALTPLSSQLKYYAGGVNSLSPETDQGLMRVEQR